MTDPTLTLTTPAGAFGPYKVMDYSLHGGYNRRTRIAAEILVHDMGDLPDNLDQTTPYSARLDMGGGLVYEGTVRVGSAIVTKDLASDLEWFRVQVEAQSTSNVYA